MMLKFWRSKKAFTLIELMIVVAIIGILAGIAIPRYLNFIRRSHEAATKGHLGALRSALAIYYSDVEGFYPAANAVGGSPFIGRGATNYLDEIKGAYEDCDTSSHDNVATIRTGVTLDGGVNNTGGWQYETSGGSLFSTTSARWLVNCSNIDTKSTTISRW